MSAMTPTEQAAAFEALILAARNVAYAFHDGIIAQAEDAWVALRAQAGESCVCCVDDGLVQEWVSKAREVAKSKGYAVTRQAVTGDRPAPVVGRP